MTDDELTDAWEACQLGRAVTHAEHVRVSWVLITRHGGAAGTLQIAEDTLRNCVAMDAADRFDPALTVRWSEAIASKMESSDALSAEQFLQQHPELLNSRLFGAPGWVSTAE